MSKLNPGAGGGSVEGVTVLLTGTVHLGHRVLWGSYGLAHGVDVGSEHEPESPSLSACSSAQLLSAKLHRVGYVAHCSFCAVLRLGDTFACRTPQCRASTCSCVAIS